MEKYTWLLEKLMQLVTMEKLDVDSFKKLREAMKERSEPFETALEQGTTEQLPLFLHACLITF